jgi:uncharacterized protein
LERQWRGAQKHKNAVKYCKIPKWSLLLANFNHEKTMIDKKLLDILACPLCKSSLIYDKSMQELICKADRIAYPIRDDIPVMLEDEARQLTNDEIDALAK